ncbi:hypothetical protein O181_018026 [Austropuccinia psidii MF-1]|uniref:Uncharacterized protein n=1 Tax=Austropuccinia psidii MF-1 TaxID=1389203 RepID=A0A9Q3C8S8_9BASI|nr:hypothetical protein [Austropuccinia psidii MF-1]
MLVMLANKHTRNACSLSNPYDHAARGFPNQDALARTPLWSTLMKAFPSRNECQDPKQADGNDSGQLAQSPQSKVIIRLMKDGNGKRTFELGLIVTHGIQTPYIEQNQPNTPRQDSPVPSFPCKQTPQQPTPGPSGTQWLEDLFREPSQTNEPPIPG